MTSRTSDAIFAHRHRVRADDAELHREADRRPEVEAVDPHPRLRERALGHRLFDPCLDALARRHVLGDDDDLGEGLVRELRVEAEPEPRRALADIGRMGEDIRIVAEDRFRLPGRLGGDANGRAFGQAHLEEQLRPLGQREELLLHPAERNDGSREDADRGEHREAAPVDAGLHDPAQAAVEAGLVDLMRVRVRARASARGRSLTPR